MARRSRFEGYVNAMKGQAEKPALFCDLHKNNVVNTTEKILTEINTTNYND